MIIFICSPMGSGKTLSLTYLGGLAKLMGYDIYSNYPINYEHTPIIKSEQIETIKNGVFLADELWSWMDCRASGGKKNLFMSSILLKSRKRGFHIFHTAQFFLQPDKRLREHTDIMAVPEYDHVTKTCQLSYYRYIGHEQIIPTPLKTFTFNARPVFELYDSYQGIYEEGAESIDHQPAKAL